LTARVPSRRNGRIDVEPPDDLHSRLARIVSAGDADRRRFERELHDGTQQELIALAVSLQLARKLADTDAEAAKKLLEELGRDVHQALDRVRELATEIYPPLLASRGLMDALRAAGVSVRVDGEPVPRYRPEVEAGIYFVCLDAAADVRLWNDDQTLGFELTAAHELPPAVTDRILALGGAVSVSGNRLTGSIPAQPLSAR
jgi:signal transduction histidine kinase